ncbi:MAG: XTP/dITP diphosphatase [Thermoanaerobacteraceae bacterium]
MLKIILATHNSHKINEIKSFFNDFNAEIISMNEIGVYDEIEESGESIEENALIKARWIKEKVDNGIIIADDTGLFVDYLNGQPGVYSARFAGENATYDDNNKKLLKLLEGVPFEKRRAYFKTVIALINGNCEHILEGRLDGYIIEKPVGKNGFGYDPLFYVPEIKKTLAEMKTEEKNKISHRALALQKLKEYLKINLEGDR